MCFLTIGGRRQAIHQKIRQTILLKANGSDHVAGFKFKAMTFNVRYDFKWDDKSEDGGINNRWKQRVGLVVETIRESGASVVMLQEDIGLAR